MLFKHTSYEKYLWRGWFRDGRSVELSWRSSQLFGFKIDESHINLSLFGVALYCPYPGSVDMDDIDINHEWRYGFTVYREGTHFYWRYVNTIWEYPWTLTWVRTSTLLKDDTWCNEVVDKDKDIWTAKHPFPYTLNNGEVQEAVATISVKEMEWRPRWRLLRPFYKTIRKYIDIQFDLEIGEGVHDWKGGVIGMSYTLKEGETPLQALHRLSHERL